jgi:hypothetical protein
MYTSSQFALTVTSPEVSAPTDAQCATINASDSRKAILLEGGANCNGTYKIWGYSKTANAWYLLKDTGAIAVADTRYAITDIDYINAFSKIYIHSTGAVQPTHWRLQAGSNSGGF